MASRREPRSARPYRLWRRRSLLAATALLAVVLPASTLPTSATAASAADVSRDRALALPGDTAADSSTGAGDAAAVQSFLDETVPALLAEHDLPGLGAVVVSDEGQVAAAGYGSADLARARALDPERTAIRIASVTKLLTTAAALVLVERGELDLDGDVNDVLTEVQVADTYPGSPVTLRHLLTHTAGFEDSILGLGSPRQVDVEPLGAYLAAHQPPRVRPPGERVVYSNYGMSLAGQLVAEVAGASFEEFVTREVLDPLRMADTTLAPGVPSGAAVGYDTDGRTPVRTVYVDQVPAGGATATVTDVGRFLRAQLNGGELDGRRVLRPETVAEMHRRQVTGDPRLSGMALGFYEGWRNEHRLLQHVGNLPGFVGLATLVPQDRAGLYVVVNGEGADDSATTAVHDLTLAYLDRFHAAPRPAAPPDAATGTGPAATVADLDRYVGTYRSSLRTGTGPTSVLDALTDVTVRAGDDGTLRTTGLTLDPAAATAEQQWEPAGPWLFRERGGQDLLAFEADETGRVTTAHAGSAPILSFDRLPWYASPGLQLAVLAAGVVVLVLSLLWWAVRGLARRVRRDGASSTRPAARHRSLRGWARPVAWVAGAVTLAVPSVLVGTAALVPQRTLTFSLLTDSGVVPSLLATVGALTILAVPLTAVAAGLGLAAWWRGWWNVAERLHYSLVVLAAAALLVLGTAYRLPEGVLLAGT